MPTATRRTRRRGSPAGPWLLAILGAALALAGCHRQPTLDYPLPPSDDPHYTDAWINRQVLTRLENDWQLGRFRIEAQTVETAVTLQGAVPTEALRQRAQRIVEAAPYVSAVRNNIVVTDHPPPGW